MTIARRISSIFKQTQNWRSYDIFARQKMSTFKSSRPAVIELAARYKDIVNELESKHTITGAKTQEEMDEAAKILFIEMCEICLWGNATDLSLLTNLTYADIQKLQGSEARKASEKNILVNDLEKAFKILSDAQKSGKKERRVDIVLDNAGFELYVDLILAGYLLASGLATTIIFHPKSIPWFVSDVLPQDFASLIYTLADPQTFYSALSEEDKQAGKTSVPLSNAEEENLKFLFQNWSTSHAEGQLVLRPNTFWTAGGSFWRLPKTEPELYEDLKESELVIFKGDLNYRKLTADVSYNHSVAELMTNGDRRHGQLRLLSRKRSDRLDPAPACACLHSGLAKQTSWSVSLRVRMSGSKRLKVAAAIAARGSGRGAGSGL